MVKQLAHIDFLDQQIDEISHEIGRHLEAMPSLPHPPGPDAGDSSAELATRATGQTDRLATAGTFDQAQADVRAAGRTGTSGVKATIGTV